MHGVNIATSAAERFAYRLPECRFSPAPGSMPADTLPALHLSEPDPRSGLSLTQNGLALRRFHPGVNVPGLPLRISIRSLPGPFGSLAPQPLPVRPGGDCFTASNPLPAIHRSAPAVQKASTPLRGFYPPRDQRFGHSPASGPASRPRPIPDRSPLPSS
jgi:hypothetical protein